MCREIENATLTFKNGKILKTEAEKGKDFLLEILKTDEGAKRIGKIGMGTNTEIDKPTKLIHLDQKIGHCMHLALGLSPQEGGGRNQSSIHLTLLKDMRTGEIYADNELVYEKGKFTI